MEMIKLVAIAKKRRTKYLNEHVRTGCTIVKLANKYNVSPARMSQILERARAEI